VLATKRQRHVVRMLDRWAISVLLDVGAIKECEAHGWMGDRTDPHAQERAFDLARRHPPTVSPIVTSVAIAEALDSIGEACPECPLLEEA
jgi:hypothetical protein